MAIKTCARETGGHSLHTMMLVDCDMVTYLDISDGLLREYCKGRGVDPADSKKVKEAMEEDWKHYRKKGGKIFYDRMVTE